MIKQLNNGILHRFKTPEHADVVIADITVVTSALSADELNFYESGHSHERCLQMTCADIIISEALGHAIRIQRDAKGAPYLTNSPFFLSISHTSNFMAMIISDRGRVAIDIEVKGRNIERVKHRFTTDTELGHLKHFFASEALLASWSVKECLFKIIKKSGVLFTDHLKIDGSEDGDKVLRVNCSVEHPAMKADYTVNSCIFEPLILSYIDATPHA